jgi:tRNA threonylcarbamoyladenosine biosynthesis protein TsaE
MNELEYTAARSTRSAAATRALGRRLGGLLQPGDVVALTGDLGAGKTELVRGICAGARVPPTEVSSPTFAIVATYRGRIPVHHADLYRIGDEDELYGTGFGDLVGGEGALLVEWADRIPAALPAERLSVRLEHVEGAPTARRIAVAGAGERHAALARRLLATARRAPQSLPRKRTARRKAAPRRRPTPARARARRRARG